MLPFDLPVPPGHSAKPQWNGEEFLLGDHRSPVLEYSENFAGWSNDLTVLHEEAAGDNHPIDIGSRDNALIQIKKFLPKPDAVIMEIGCSSGFLIRDMVKEFPDAVIVGADVVKEPLYRLAKDLPGIPLIQFDLLQCPLPEKSVDVLIMINVLEHIEDDLNALKRAYTLLKPSGLLIIEVPAGSYLYDGYDAELQHFRRYSSFELSDKLMKAGFNISRKSHLGFLLFPAFAVVKLLNKWLPSKRKNTLVRDQAASSSNSGLIKLAMDFENKYLSKFKLPFGIRVLAVANKNTE